MLGKRPRPLQRTRSKMLLMPDENLLCSPAVEPSHEKPKLSAPVFGVARQVIGFNPVNKDNDAVGSPRSVLTNVGSGCSQARSPRSGLEGLISTPRPWEKKGSDVVGLGIVVSLSAVEDVPRIPAVESPKTLMIPFQCTTSSTCQQPSSLSRSQPIPIGQSQSPSTSRGTGEHRQVWCSPADVFEESFSWSSKGLQSHGNKQEDFSLYSTSEDMDMEVRESIFTAASPASSCGENSGLLLGIDFLSSCYFCKRQLFHGKDVYMYRGDRAFCSVECRYQQIVIDERMEKCSTSALKSGNSAAPSNAKHGDGGLTSTTAAAA